MSAQKGYLDYINDSVNTLESDQTKESLENLKQAIEYNANDPLAHVALGLTLMSGKQVDDAMAEFTAAVDIDDSCAEAIYGQGLFYLLKGQIGTAISTFCQAQSANPDLDMQGTIEYVKALSSGSYPHTMPDHTDDQLQALYALALMNDGHYADAAAILKELQGKVMRLSLGERLGCSMTFQKQNPLLASGWPLKEGYRSPSVYKADLPVVSGHVTLKADLSKVKSVNIVSFFVDSKLVGISNQSLQYSWDTTRFENGAHNVKIQGSDIDGNTVSEKTMSVLVRNANAAGRTPRLRSGDEAKAWSRLWDMLKLKPSTAAINYYLAICSEKQNDRNTEIDALERVLAANPNYADAAKRLISINDSDGKYIKLSKINTSHKAMAITFDDGPKEHTAELLNILKEKGIKATFFIVGKQAEIYPELIKRMADEGHEIQNHTYSHRDMEYLPERDIIQEIYKTSSIVRSITGHGTQFVRPPGGHEGKKFPLVAKRFGIKAVMYTSDCAKLEGTTKKKIYDYEISSAKPGAIALMHNPETITLQALPDIIDKLKSAGYELVTLSELLQQGS